MKKILATLAGTVVLALGAGACSAVDTEDATSIAPSTAQSTSVVTHPTQREFDRYDYYNRPNRSVTRPVKPVISAHENHVKLVNAANRAARANAAKLARVAAAKAKAARIANAKAAQAKLAKKVVKHKKTVVKKIVKSVKVSLSGIARCIGKYESGNNPKAQNPTTTASGYFQFVNGTWNHYKGYSRAKDAPLSVQLEKFYQVWDGGRGAGNWVTAHKCGY